MIKTIIHTKPRITHIKPSACQTTKKYHYYNNVEKNNNKYNYYYGNNDTCNKSYKSISSLSRRIVNSSLVIATTLVSSAINVTNLGIIPVSATSTGLTFELQSTPTLTITVSTDDGNGSSNNVADGDTLQLNVNPTNTGVFSSKDINIEVGNNDAAGF